jgi:predicted RNase H-like nuclease (RuvC/YqgF family)
MDSKDIDHILRTNQYYIAQVSSMEIKISELKAQLHAKDFEIDYLSTKLSPSQAAQRKPPEKTDIELQLKVALQENASLKKQLSGIEEVSILKSQLEQALHMKELFEQKYRELNLQLLITDKNKAFDNESENILSSLNKELEKERKVLAELRAQYDVSCRENTELKQEVAERNKQIHELKRRLFKDKSVEREKILNNTFETESKAPNQLMNNTLMLRPGSAHQSRKNSPDIKTLKASHIRKNFQFHSPKLNLSTDYVKRPKIVSISLETSLLKQIGH